MSTATPFEPVRINLGQQALQHLRDKIYRAEIPPGSPLGIREMATQMGISRSPVRDAFLLLAAEGLIELTPSGTYQVISVNHKFIEDVFVMRMALEVASVRQCVKHATDSQLSPLISTWAGWLEGKTTTPDPTILESHIAADQHLHGSLAEFSNNPLLKSTLETIIPKASLIRRWSYIGGVPETHLLTLATEHLAILNAIRERDETGAVEAVSHHLDRARHRSLSRLVR
jgi:DNA-binding GntR family transcriptional regulator